MAEQMAIMSDIHFGNRDVGRPVLWFVTKIADGTGALQVLGEKDAIELIRSSKVGDIKDLEGKPCLVDVGGGFIKFIKILDI